MLQGHALVRWVLLAIGALYGGAAVGAAVAVGRRGGWRQAVAAPVGFALLHASWGTGFLLGLVRFLPRWFRREPAPPHLRTCREETA